VLGISDSIGKNVPSHIKEEFQNQFQPNQFSKFQKPNFIPVARRQSGGGSVFHSFPSNMNFSIYINLDQYPGFFPVQESYNRILGWVISALQKTGKGYEKAGKSDLVIRDSHGDTKKISGNAQFRKKGTLVHHGTLILSESLITKIEETLLHPPEEPDYRKNRNHRDFLTYLPSEFSPRDWSLKLWEEMVHFFDLQNNGKWSDGIAKREFWKTVSVEAKSLYHSKYTNHEFIFLKE
jgi:lipoate-protein ligase A